MASWHKRGASKGSTRLSPREYAALAVRISGNRHGADVIARMESYLGARAARLGPVDLTRNVLISWQSRVCRAYARPPLVSGLTAELAAVMGDHTAQTVIDRYGQAGGRPMPTSQAQASHEAMRLQEGAAGYAGVRIGWSARTGRIVLEVIPPDDLEPVYASDDPTEPTIIRHHGVRHLGGEPIEVVEVYDLTDLSSPSYRVYKDGDEGQDVTQEVHGRTFTGQAYLDEWSYQDGRPYHPIVMRGHPDRLYDRLQQVEATLATAIRWTAWGSGCDFASHPGRNVRGLALASMTSSTGEAAVGIADGPEVIKRWVDMDPENPGDHWQDAPAYDPLTMARAVGLYETMALSMIDLPMQLEATGGEPTAREAEALEERIQGTLPEARRFDAELLRRCAALANRVDEIPASGIPEGPYGVLYRSEIDAALPQIEELAEDGEE